MITIGIPFFNDELYLDYAIKSVFNQTYEDWKLILISDGGNDNSLSIARSYEYDSRVTVIHDGYNRKLPYRLNQIISLTKTKYLARMDADDIMHPLRIESQLKFMESNPEVDIVGTNAYIIDASNNVIGIRKKIIKSINFQKCTSFIHPSILGKTEWFKKNLYDENAIRIEDAELWYRTSKNSNFVALSKPYLFYREIDNNNYKKYILANKSKKHILKKYNNLYWRIFFIKKMIKGCVFFIFNLFESENELLRRRNQTIFKENLKYFYYI